MFTIFLPFTVVPKTGFAVLISFHPFNLWFRFTTVFDIEQDNLSLLDDHILKTITNDEWFH